MLEGYYKRFWRIRVNHSSGFTSNPGRIALNSIGIKIAISDSNGSVISNGDGVSNLTLGTISVSPYNSTFAKFSIPLRFVDQSQYFGVSGSLGGKITDQSGQTIGVISTRNIDVNTQAAFSGLLSGYVSSTASPKSVVAHLEFQTSFGAFSEVIPMPKILDLELSTPSFIGWIILAFILAGIDFFFLYVLISPNASFVENLTPARLDPFFTAMHKFITPTLPIIGLIIAFLIFFDQIFRQTRIEGGFVIIMSTLFVWYIFNVFQGGTLHISIPAGIVQNVTGYIYCECLSHHVVVDTTVALVDRKGRANAVLFEQASRKPLMYVYSSISSSAPEIQE
ncbi:MAG: hypothetical protein JRN15_00420 [Nitrososphaerota archaeon]|nr:hypothetical protein [Nitrososphaerota archaeon]